MKIAIVIPCLNEQDQIGHVIKACQEHVARADVYVLDNGSIDRTAERAEHEGAHVIHSPMRGKGNAIRHAFQVIEADYYVMIDGDGTYPPIEIPRLIDHAIQCNYDMVVGSRLEKGDPLAFRRFHLFGNRMFSFVASRLFDHPIHDLLSGCRIISRRLVNQIDILSCEFELETELTLRTLAQNMSYGEIPIHYTKRLGTDRSKLRSFRDGWKILGTVVRLWRAFHPLRYFATLAVLSLAATFKAKSPIEQNLFSLFTVAFLALGFNLDAKLSVAKLRRKKDRSQTGRSEDSADANPARDPRTDEDGEKDRSLRQVG